MYLISDGVQSKENQRTDLQQDKWNTGIAYPKTHFLLKVKRRGGKENKRVKQWFGFSDVMIIYKVR